MKKLLFILLFTIPFFGFGQLSLLDEKNGFKNIKLGTNVLEYGFIKKSSSSDKSFSFGDMDPKKISHPFIGDEEMDFNDMSFYGKVKECDLWIVDQENTILHTFPNNTKIEKIFIETYNNLILSITLYIDQDVTISIKNKLVNVFGTPTKDGCKNFNDLYNRERSCSVEWTTDKVNLMLMSYCDPYERLFDKYSVTHNGWVIKYEHIKLNSIVEEIKTKSKERSKQRLKDQF